jgi:hypothetical protein
VIAVRRKPVGSGFGVTGPSALTSHDEQSKARLLTSTKSHSPNTCDYQEVIPIGCQTADEPDMCSNAQN